MREVRNLLLVAVRLIDVPDVLIGKLVLVALVHKLRRGIDKADAVVRLVLLQHNDASHDGSAEKQVRRQLNHRIHKVVLRKVTPYLLLRTATVKHPGELNDGSRALGGEPSQHVHGKGEVRFASWRQHTRRGVTRIVDKRHVAVALPRHTVRRIAHNGIERFLTLMLGVEQRIALLNVEMVVIHIVQKHVHAAEVVSLEVNLLTEKALTHILCPQHTVEVEQQRTRTTGRVVHFVH